MAGRTGTAPGTARAKGSTTSEDAGAGGQRRAKIGPLEVPNGPVTAHFPEAIFPPGMRTRVHSHPGPEAFYVVEGEQCMERPPTRSASVRAPPSSFAMDRIFRQLLADVVKSCLSLHQPERPLLRRTAAGSRPAIATGERHNAKTKCATVSPAETLRDQFHSRFRVVNGPAAFSIEGCKTEHWTGSHRSCIVCR